MKTGKLAFVICRLSVVFALFVWSAVLALAPKDLPLIPHHLVAVNAGLDPLLCPDTTHSESILEQSPPICSSTICFYSPQFLAFNLRRLRFFDRDILISGVNFNHPVDVTTSQGKVLFALQGKGYSPQQLFNQHYVAAQLSLALMPLPGVISALPSSLSCYGLSFEPVTLSNGVTISPDSSLGALLTQCDLAALKPPSMERDADMVALANILSLLNTCRRL